jgi:esterase
MELFYRKFGTGQPLIILHGLLGCSDNWLTIAKSLSDNFEIFLPDQRNHGNSPHSDEIDYNILANDLNEFINFHSISKPVIAGHSMGGKVVMKFSQTFHNNLQSMVIIDVAPKKYSFEKSETVEIRRIIDSMINLDFENVKSLKEAESFLSKEIIDVRVLNFILKNLKRNSENKYYWKINIEAIRNKYLNFLESPFEVNFSGKINTPSLFIRGANSRYILYEDIILIENVFTQSTFVTIPDSGHWLHIEQKELLLNTLKLFLQ